MGKFYSHGCPPRRPPLPTAQLLSLDENPSYLAFYYGVRSFSLAPPGKVQNSTSPLYLHYRFGTSCMERGATCSMAQS